MLTVLGAVFAISVLIGVPIAMGLGLAALGGILAWGKVPLYLIPQRMFTGVDSFVLMAIPFFMLAGELMDSTGILERMLKFADALVGRFRGGIAHVNVVAGMILSGVSGSAVADASAIGSALLPVMRKEYDVDFGSGVVAGAAALGPIIPPSIPMIIYAASTSGMSVAALFLSGMIPGLMIGFGMMAIIYIIARKRGYPVRQGRVTAREFLARTKRAIPALVMPIVVLGEMQIWNNQVWQLAYGYTQPDTRTLDEFSSDELLALAKKHLREFSHVGFTETFSADADIICKALGFPAQKPDEQMPMENVTPQRPSLAEQPDEVKAMLMRLTELDRELYDHARNTLAASRETKSGRRWWRW